jgi:hypothetical protein
VQYADYRTERAILALVEAAKAIEVAEQLVGPIQQVNDHALSAIGYWFLR